MSRGGAIVERTGGMEKAALLISMSVVATGGMAVSEAVNMAQDATDVWDRGMGPFVLLVCAMLCSVVVYLFRTARSDSAKHHGERDQMQQALITLVSEASADRVKTNDALDSILDELRRISGR